MKLVDISISKIIYSQSDKKYKIIFSQVLKEKHFAIFLSSPNLFDFPPARITAKILLSFIL